MSIERAISLLFQAIVLVVLIALLFWILQKLGIL